MQLSVHPPEQPEQLLSQPDVHCEPQCELQLPSQELEQPEVQLRKQPVPEQLSWQLLAQYEEQPEVHRLEQLSAQVASHPPRQVLEQPPEQPPLQPEQPPEQPPEQLLAQLREQPPEQLPEQPEQPPEQPPEQLPEHPPEQPVAQLREQPPEQPVEHDPVQLVQAELQPVEHNPVHWAAHPVAEAVSEMALSSLSVCAAFDMASAVIFEPSAGVSAVPLMTSRGCTIFWMCSFRMRPPVAGSVLYGLLA